MKTRLKYILAIILGPIILTIGCKKDFLDKKPATNINVPTTITDLQLLLDNQSVLNVVSPGLNEVSTDDYQIGYNELNALTSYYRNTYKWEKDIFQGEGNVLDWNSAYTGVLTTNVVLEQVEKIAKDNSNSSVIDNIRGSALFIRAFLFFDLAQTFSMPYDKATAASDLGIPLRLEADINSPSSRPTLQTTYNQILSDALKAKSLLSENYTNTNFNRPTKAAAYGFLSRIYLTMRDYVKSGLYADSALQIHKTLYDYNTISKTNATPFTLLTNIEMLYESRQVPTLFTNLFRGSANYSIVPALYNSYDSNDLRKAIYFTITATGFGLKNGYTGTRDISHSINTDELYLTRAECYARNGKTTEAMADLNTLMKMRWSNAVPFPTFTASSSTEALAQILTERRKELVMRGLRWNDIRRLNKEGYNITLTRTLNGITYTLPPNDARFALPIPPDVIARSGIQQNIR